MGASQAKQRVGVYLADTLAEPGAAAPEGRLGFVADNIRSERYEADRIKQCQPILAIIGNPPYRRLKTGEVGELVGNWMDELWDDLKEPVRNAGWANQLNTFPEFSIAFWRWAIWKIFESEGAPGRGVVAYISNRPFLAGKPYAGLRKMLRERFDSIEIIDLRGDVRRGERAGVISDQGVFNIQVGTAITLAIADRSKADGELAGIYYIDSWAEGLFSRDAKLNWLIAGSETGTRLGAVDVVRGLLDDMKPEPFQREVWPSLSSCFAFRKSGVKTQNDPVLVKVNRSDLKSDVRPLIASRHDPIYQPQLERQIMYRPLDRRWLYNDPKLVKRHGPELQSVWGANNVALYAMPFATGAGPAVWCHGLVPDYHAFSGRGGYAFPLRDNRPGHGPFNISPALLAGLAASYGVPVGAEDAFHAILALLSATFYTLRFAEDLEDVFPHVPFPGDHTLFLAAAELGREIRALETFARPPSPNFLTRTLARVETQPSGTLDASDWSEGEFFLCADRTGRVSGVPKEIWDFSVSGYRLLPRWLDARKGLAAEHALITQMRDVVGRIAELIDLFARADTLLAQILPSTLTSGGLGLQTNETASGDE
jgi:predicted helicase